MHSLHIQCMCIYLIHIIVYPLFMMIIFERVPVIAGDQFDYGDECRIKHIATQKYLAVTKHEDEYCFVRHVA